MNAPLTYHYSYHDLGITFRQLEKQMGYKQAGTLPEPVAEALLELMDQAEALSDIRGGYVIKEDVKLEHDTGRIYSHGHFFDTGQIISKQLANTQKLAWFLCTAGEELSAYSRKMAREGDQIRSYANDILANEIVETAMDKIQQELSDTMTEQGLKTTNRFSPGYCGWDTGQQKYLFKAFPQGYLNISLTDSCLMIPVKSVSGLIGIGEEVRYREYSCSQCDDKFCLYRNRG